MAIDTSVKVFKSTDAGAPALSGTAGALIAVLDACLVNGYSLLTTQSVAISGGVATATFATAHGFAAGRVALVAGATPAGLNGERRVISATTNSLTFDATGLADGSATGTITLKMAPAGWVKFFSDTIRSLAVFKSANPRSLGGCLRIDDSGAPTARVVAYEFMSDIDTGAGMTPRSDQVAGGFYWPKAVSGGGAGSRPWVLIADSLGFYLCVAAYSSESPYFYISYFGDYPSFAQVDAYAWALTGNVTTSGYFRSGNVGSCVGLIDPVIEMGCVSPRRSSGVGGSTLLSKTVMGATAMSVGAMVGGSEYRFSYPNGAGCLLIVSPVWLLESGLSLRGQLPGIYGTPQNISTLGWLTGRLDDSGVPGRLLMHIKTGDIDSSGPVGGMWIDVTGPWR